MGINIVSCRDLDDLCLIKLRAKANWVIIVKACKSVWVILPRGRFIDVRELANRYSNTGIFSSELKGKLLKRPTSQ